MKKLIAASLLSVVALALSSGQASAWWFFKKHCCDGYSLCIRPYNAFSPAARGSLYLDGIYPFAMNHGGMGGCPHCGHGGHGCQPGCFGGEAWGGDCCGESGTIIEGHSHAAPATPAAPESIAPPSSPSGPSFQAPAPQGGEAPKAPTSMLPYRPGMGYGYAPAAGYGYNPAAVPGYGYYPAAGYGYAPNMPVQGYPMAFNPYMMPQGPMGGGR